MAFSSFRLMLGSSNSATGANILYTWGDNTSGQTGQGVTSGYTPYPTIVGTTTTWTKAVANDSAFGFVQKSDGTLWAWGSGTNAQTGLGSATSVSVPTQTSLSGTITMVAASTSGTGLAIKSDGTLWSWGTNTNGATGQGTTVGTTLTPTQVGTDTDWAWVASGDAMTIAIKTNGTMWSTGLNAAGRTGQNTTVGTITTLTQIGTDTNWANVACENSFCIAIKTTGAMYSWGSNSSGQTGLGTTAGNTLVPTQIGAVTTWSKVDCGQGFAVAIRTDGTMWSWGSNNEYRTGRNTNGAATTSPTQIGVATGWVDVNCGLSFAFAIRSDKTLWGWGDNTNFQTGLGLNGASAQFPTQISSQPKWVTTPAGGIAWGGAIGGNVDSAILTDGFVPKAEAFRTFGTGALEAGYPIQGSSSQFYVVQHGTVSGNGTVSVNIVSNNGGFTSFGSPLTVSSTANNQIFGDRIDDNNFLVTYPEDNATDSKVARILNTAGTLSMPAGPSTVATSTSVNAAAVAVLDSTNAIVFTQCSTSANNRLSLINASTLAVIQTTTDGSKVANTNGQFSLIAVSPTLAVIAYNNTSNVINLVGIDVVSGTSLTVNNAFSTGITITAGSCMIQKISTTKILLMYRLGNFAIAARTVDVASGGSFTVNTEYNTAVSNASTATSMIRPALYGSNFVTGYLDSSTSQRIAIAMRVTGNVVDFSTKQFPIEISNTGTVGLNALAHEFVSLNSTQVGVVYQSLTNRAAATARLLVANVLDMADTTPSWTAINSSKSGPSTDQSGGYYLKANGVCIGGNRVLMVGTNNTETVLYTLDLKGGTSNAAVFNELSTPIADTSYFSIAATSYYITGSVQRAIICYGSSSPVNTRVVSVNGSGVVSLNTATTFTATGYSTGIGNNWAIPLTNESILFLWKDTTNNAILGRVITSSALTISSTGTETTVFNSANEVYQESLQWAVIDPTRVLVSIRSINSVSLQETLRLLVIKVSGTTFSVGSAVNVYTGYTNNQINRQSLLVFPNTNTGIVTYTNDVATINNTNLLARGINISDTTITLGTQNTLVVNGAYGQVSSTNAKNVAVSSNQGIYNYYNTSGASQIMLLTYTDINTIIAGTPVTLTTSVASNYFLMKASNGNQFFSFSQVSGGCNFWQVYRG